MKRLGEATRLIVADDHPLFRGALCEAVAGLFGNGDVVQAGSFEEITKLLEREGEIDGPRRAVERDGVARRDDRVSADLDPVADKRDTRRRRCGCDAHRDVHAKHVHAVKTLIAVQVVLLAVLGTFTVFILALALGGE